MCALMFLLAWGPAPAAAQDLGHRLGLAPRIALLVGGGDLLDGGFGIEGTGGIRLGDSPLWIRGDAGFLGLGAVTPTPGGGTADNTLFTLLVGPEVEGRIGIVLPFLHAWAGYAINVPGGSASTADTNGSSAFGAGAGLRLRLSSASRPALIEAGVRLTRIGELSFARIGDSVDTDVVAMELRLGLLVGLP